MIGLKFFRLVRSRAMAQELDHNLPNPSLSLVRERYVHRCGGQSFRALGRGAGEPKCQSLSARNGSRTSGVFSPDWDRKEDPKEHAPRFAWKYIANTVVEDETCTRAPDMHKISAGFGGAKVAEERSAPKPLFFFSPTSYAAAFSAPIYTDVSSDLEPSSVRSPETTAVEAEEGKMNIVCTVLGLRTSHDIAVYTLRPLSTPTLWARSA